MNKVVPTTKIKNNILNKSTVKEIKEIDQQRAVIEITYLLYNGPVSYLYQ